MNPDPLYVSEFDDPIWQRGFDRGRESGWDDGYAAGRRLAVIDGLIVLIVGALIGATVMLLWSDFLGRVGPPPGAQIIPAGAVVAVPAAPVETAQPDPALPGATRGAPLSGVASWYAADGLVAAAGPRLRTGHWRGRVVVVTAGSASVTVRLTDWCQCYGTRLLDLSDDAFSHLAPLARGLVRVTIEPGPAPTLPPTDAIGKEPAA